MHVYTFIYLLVANVQDELWYALADEEICVLLNDYKMDVIVDFISKYNYEKGKLSNNMDCISVETNQVNIMNDASASMETECIIGMNESFHPTEPFPSAASFDADPNHSIISSDSNINSPSTSKLTSLEATGSYYLKSTM